MFLDMGKGLEKFKKRLILFEENPEWHGNVKKKIQVCGKGLEKNS